MSEVKQKNASKKILQIALLAIGLIFLVGGGLFLYKKENPTGKIEVTASAEALMADGYVPLSEAMKAGKYKGTIKDEAKAVFTKKDAGLTISIEFLFDENVCIKNEYQFDLTNAMVWSEGMCFIKQDKLKEIINIEVVYEDEALVIKPLEYDVHEWTTAFAPLVAHAGGGYRHGGKETTYTNSLDAIIQNYDLGHRVFEIDFRLTSDKELAAIHSWKDENGENIKMTAAQWKEHGEVKGVQCQTILLGDVLDQMVINKDMFLVTDTKTAKVGKNMKREFESIKSEAMKRDPELLQRIIPQIYNIDMYTVVTEIYPFQSIIFTLYKAEESDEEILDFMAAHDDIKVITTRGNEKGRLDLVGPLGERDKLVYAHTLNKRKEIEAMHKLGVYGIYTDFILPSDWETYMGIAN